MPVKQITDVSRFSKRARYLLKQSKVVTRDERTADVLERLQAIGRVGLIGGAVRDMAFTTLRGFVSDLDFVVEVSDQKAYWKLTEEYCAVVNKFGGYRISLNGIHIDFWDAKKTWASTNGIVHVSSLEDVLNTTFFNVDAIMYVLNENQVKLKDGTLQALEGRFLDINLSPNPNPLGAAVRALRRMCQFDMVASVALANFVAAQIDNHGWDKMVRIERQAYPASNTLQNVAAKPKNSEEFLNIMTDNNYKLPLIEQLVLQL